MDIANLCDLYSRQILILFKIVTKTVDACFWPEKVPWGPFTLVISAAISSAIFFWCCMQTSRIVMNVLSICALVWTFITYPLKSCKRVYGPLFSCQNIQECGYILTPVTSPLLKFRCITACALIPTISSFQTITSPIYHMHARTMLSVSLYKENAVLYSCSGNITVYLVTENIAQYYSLSWIMKGL